MTSTISALRAREILDSRGKPTLEVEIHLDDHSIGVAAVPSGASTGKHEAIELRDNDAQRFNGSGVLQTISKIDQIIAPTLLGRSPFEQEAIDHHLIELDGTPDKSYLGANGLLGVSLAVAHAAATSRKQQLYQYLRAHHKLVLPVPLFNVLNGGKHAANSADIQEFMVVPSGLQSFSSALQCGAEVYHALKNVLASEGYNTNVGDEGGYAPSLPSDRHALRALTDAIDEAGYKPGKDVFIALDVAASELFVDGRYILPRNNISFTSKDMVEFLSELVDEFPIISIEDGLDQDDWNGWVLLMEKLGGTIQLVGDDLLTTNPSRIRQAIELHAANALLVKPNQIGTLTETLQASNLAHSAGWETIMSHRSGETADTTIADLSVATGAGQIKAGAPARSERVVKYNRLLRIANEQGDAVAYSGMKPYVSYKGRDQNRPWGSGLGDVRTD